MDAETFFDHEIDHNPKPEDAGTIKIYASIVGIFDPARRCPTSPVLSRTDTFRSREARNGGGNQVLKAFLIDAGIETWVLYDLYAFIDEIVILRREYSPRCSLTVRMTIDPIVEEAPVFFNSRPVTKVAVRIYNDKTSCICDTCSICLEEFGTGERVVTLRCDHVFHDQCVFPWFKTSLVCPLCRFEV